jgi:hypothetical protein
MKEGEGMLMEDNIKCPICFAPLVASPTPSIWKVHVECTKCDFKDTRYLSEPNLKPRRGE